MPTLGEDKELKTIFENNKKWVAQQVAADPAYFERQAEGQSPSILWIGCSDSRVPANRIMGLDTGEVFVVRNVANQVLGTDVSMMSVLQYAVDYLKIPHIVICGHYDCGGVKASLENVDHVPPLENWLRHIRDTYRIHRAELDALRDVKKKQRRLVELNVVEQCLEVFKTGVVQRNRVQSYQAADAPYTTPRIHGCVYDPGTGELKELDINWKRELDRLGPIYNLYEPSDAPLLQEKPNQPQAIPHEPAKKKKFLGVFSR
jgi:carbonic anhydrase